MIDTYYTLLIPVLLAGFYMAWNIGANDVANAMGTSVGSGSLRLRQAVVLAAILEFAGALFFGSYVTDTIQQGIVDPQAFVSTPLIYVYGMLASLLSAGIWLQLASYFGWPVSTTHTIVGALIGFGAVVGGADAVYWESVATIVLSWIVSPLMGGILAYGAFNLIREHIFYSQNPIAATKRIAPILVFLIIFLLSLMLVHKGLKHIHLNFSFLHAVWVSLLIGCAGAFICWFCLRRIPNDQTASKRSANPELKRALEKAKKNLSRVRSSAAHGMAVQANRLFLEVEVLEQQMDAELSKGNIKSEYLIVEKIFGYLQVISACIMAFGHGANDVANAIGPLAAAVEVILTGTIPTELTLPLHMLALGGIGIVIGLATWGWRVIDTIGRKITELTPSRGFAAELGAAATIVIATRLGLPISTTHTLVGAVVGVGLARGMEALDLSKTRDIFISWMVTVPLGAALSVVLFYCIQGVFG